MLLIVSTGQKSCSIAIRIVALCKELCKAEYALSEMMDGAKHDLSMHSTASPSACQSKSQLGILSMASLFGVICEVLDLHVYSCADVLI